MLPTWILEKYFSESSDDGTIENEQNLELKQLNTKKDNFTPVIL